MASDNGPDNRWTFDPLALGLVALGITAIIAITTLSVLHIPTPGSLDAVVYTTSGAIAAAYGVSRAKGSNGNGQSAAASK